LKVLFLLNRYYDDGPGILIHSLVKQLKNYSIVESHTAALTSTGPLEAAFQEIDVPTRVIGMRGAYDLKRFLSLVRLLRREKFDIIHTNLIRADIIGRLAGRCARVPIILTTEHGIHTWLVKGKMVEWIVRRLYRYTARFTDRIITVSDYVKERLILSGIPASKCQRIYNGVDINRYVPISSDEKKDFRKYLADFEFENLIGIVANMVELKGHIFFIQAIPLILQRHPDSLFVFVGRGPLQSSLEEDVKKLGLSQRVRFLGKLLAVTPKLIASLDVLVQPSLTESFGLVVAEAMATGVPVVASRVGGVPEIVEDGVTGFLVEPQNPGELAAQVNYLLTNKLEAREFGEAGRKRVVSNFSIEYTAEEYYQLYRRLFSQKVQQSGGAF
jgi:glycosyltransferase involved in cell wall biosynthesis